MIIYLNPLLAGQLDKKSSINSELKYGLEVCKVAVERHIYMSDINYYARVIFGIEGGYVGSSILASIKNRQESYIAAFDKAEFQVSQARMIQNQTQKNFGFIRVNTFNLQPDGSIMQKQMLINQVFYMVMLHFS